MTGLADENDRCIFGEYPGPLKEVLGIRVEETDALFPEETNRMIIRDQSLDLKESYDCGFLCDVMHTESAEPLAVFGSDFYSGSACLTVNRYGEGKAYYIGTEPSEEFLADFAAKLCREADITPMFQASENVEITSRISDKAEVVFVINHNEAEAEIDFKDSRLKNYLTGETLTGIQKINSRDVWVLENRNRNSC
jgi:beta-galactosidase